MEDLEKLILGYYERMVDNKGRFIVPEKFQIDEVYYLKYKDKCLIFYPKKYYLAVFKKYLEKSELDEERTAFFSAVKIKLDSKKRMQIPSDIRDKLEVKPNEKVKLLGHGNCFIMVQDSYKKFFK